MFRVDDRLTEFAHSATATVVGTGDASGRPRVSYGWGLRVHEDRETLDVFLDAERADGALADLEATGRIAVTLADPVSYRSVQFKGRFIRARAPEGDDIDWVARSREAFLVAVTLVGDSPTAMRNRWLDEVVRIEFAVEQVFDQTPGPAAGAPL